MRSAAKFNPLQCFFYQQVNDENSEYARINI